MRVRRVVTGRTEGGRSVFVSDEWVEPTTIQLLPGAEFHRLWGSDAPVSLPTDGVRPPAPGYFPPPGGFRFSYFTLGPDSVTVPPDLDVPAALRELSERLPGLGEAMEPDNPGMHTTDTIDFALVVSGEVWLELDDGAEVRLSPGDCVVQNGTRHRWSNRTSDPCVIAVALLGARRSGAGQGALDQLRTMIGHHIWATLLLIDHCAQLSPEQLELSAPGTAGSIFTTLSHLVRADGRYQKRLLGEERGPRPDPSSLSELRAEMEQQAERWAEVLERLDQLDVTISAEPWQTPPYPEIQHASGLVLTQAVHHGNEHRAHVCTVLGTHGLDVPEVSVWEYFRILTIGSP